MNKMLLLLVGCLLANWSLAVCQGAASSDDFVGTWKLNTGKSSPGIERESIQIDSKADQYKFLCERLLDNGTELNWWFLTDMKGECVNHTQVNGKPMSSTSCITRSSPRKFINDTKFLHEEYEMSSDGRHLTVHTKFKLHDHPLPDMKLVFDRVVNE